MPTGFGTSPFGRCAYGNGEPDAPGTVPTGYTTASRYLDPGTGDYSIDATTGHQRQISATAQKVILALRIGLGSAAAALQLGVDRPQKMGDQFDREIDDRIRKALRHLTDVQKVMRIENIESQRGGVSGRAAINLRYKNLATGESEDVEFS